MIGIAASGLTGHDLATIVAGLAAGAGGAQLLRLAFFRKQESESLVVTSTEGGVKILNGVIEALHRELDRKDEQLAARDATIATLEGENAELRKLSGRRRQDR